MQCRAATAKKVTGALYEEVITHITPHTVSKVVSPVVYNLKDENGGTHFKIHVKDLMATIAD